MPTIRHKNGKIYLDHAQLLSEAPQFSYLAEPAVVGDAQIFLQSYVGFADNQAVLIESLGSETAEISTINGTPSVNAGCVFDSVLVRSHPVGSKVYIIDYDQIELSHATTSTGSKTVLTLNSGIVSVQPDTKVQIYNESEFSSGYYFARYKNTITGLFSDYSDALPYGGWDKNTAGFMIDRSLSDLSEKLSTKVTRYDCYEWMTDCLKLIQGKLKRWPEHYTYNSVLGQIQRGDHTTAMPTDAYDTETNKSIIALRVGSDKKLTYLSPGDFDNEMGDVNYTQVRTQAVAAQTTLLVNNSYDFSDSGSVSVYVANVKYSITYTGVTRSSTAGVLTGIPASGTGSISVTIPVDTWVWQNEVEGIPTWFTVRNGNIETWPLADSAHDNQNLFGDYSHVATTIDSDGDTIDVQRYDAVQSYLTWRIRMKAKNNGTLDLQDGYYLMYKEKLNDAIRTLPSNNAFRVRPSLNRIGNTRTSRRSADIQDLTIDQQ
jgi:hypothetical protein